MSKIKLAVAAGSYCGGCDMSIVNLNELLIPIDDAIELKYWQLAADFKIKDVKALILILLLNYLIRLMSMVIIWMIQAQIICVLNLNI